MLFVCRDKTWNTKESKPQNRRKATHFVTFLCSPGLAAFRHGQWRNIQTLQTQNCFSVRHKYSTVKVGSPGGFEPLTIYPGRTQCATRLTLLRYVPAPPAPTTKLTSYYSVSGKSRLKPRERARDLAGIAPRRRGRHEITYPVRRAASGFCPQCSGSRDLCPGAASGWSVMCGTRTTSRSWCRRRRVQRTRLKGIW